MKTPTVIDASECSELEVAIEYAVCWCAPILRSEILFLSPLSDPGAFVCELADLSVTFE